MDAKYITFYEFGQPEAVLKVEHKKIQRPKEDEVLVRMLARPINPSDLIPIRGAYSQRIALPVIPGYEGVGIVEEVGSLVSNHLVGKRVLPLRGEGTWQEFVKTSAQFAVPIPDTMDDFIASQMYINPITAWVICTEELRLQRNDILVVNACSSSIGRIFAQLSKILGFRLIAVTRNHTYTKELLNLGASYVINTSETPLRVAMMEITNGRGADAAIDSIGGFSGTDLAYCVHPDGIFLSIGLLSGVQVNWAEIAHQAKVKAKIFHLRHWNNRVSTEAWQEAFQQIITFIQDHKLKLMMTDSHYDLINVKEAITVVETSKARKGKVFLTS